MPRCETCEVSLGAARVAAGLDVCNDPDHGKPLPRGQDSRRGRTRCAVMGCSGFAPERDAKLPERIKELTSGTCWCDDHSKIARREAAALQTGNAEALSRSAVGKLHDFQGNRPCSSELSAVGASRKASIRVISWRMLASLSFSAAAYRTK